MLIVLLLLLPLAFAAEWTIVRLAYKLKLFDSPNLRKIHHAKIPRLGGVLIFPLMVVGLLLLLAVDYRQARSLFDPVRTTLMGLLLGMLMVFVCGIFDDLYGLRYRNKFVAQILSGLAMCCFGLSISQMYGFLGLHDLGTPLAWTMTILAVMYVTNAMNFIDGIDGLAGSLSLIALLYYGAWLRSIGAVGLAWLAALVMLALVVLLAFNLFGSPKGKTKVFMGDSGSLSLGVILSALGIFLLCNLPADPALPDRFVLAVAPLLLPCFDVVRVVIYRMVHHKNIFEADKSHIHHKLLAHGYSQLATLGMILLINLLMIVSAIVLARYVGSNIVILCEVLFFTLIIFAINKKT